MTSASFLSTALILFIMGALEVLYIAIAREGCRRALLNIFVAFQGLLLIGLGFSITALGGSREGHELWLLVAALIIAGPALLIFPKKSREFLLSMLQEGHTVLMRALLLFDAMLRCAVGAGLIYFAANYRAF